MAKQEWQAPVLETLDVKETMYGKGVTEVDSVTINDKDIYDPS
ncbi:hypothetical protein IJ21_43380 [Paenibacillus sp. 32O-W]|jgi:hypothetical protein|uniref:Paeninodin family lasso peptide n=1 Tax=Paenibacillus cisolokensis TaxID=1658519 RepID=A0ABQ4N600_9BACL|nr:MULTISPECIES: paeninodin family lasso peptide [Paenibacillus]ALS29701.1 hypothetical protein IJ21_43380 [Paenibacillus sp. 32O-W]GIQ63559.1 hypothetical protein PACILC2_21270 [Paenibacillus cisolokensis]